MANEKYIMRLEAKRADLLDQVRRLDKRIDALLKSNRTPKVITNA